MAQPAISASPAQARPAKAAHYSSALSAALLHGAWADGHAGKDAKGYDISWGELVRKWAKHTGGNTTLIHHLRDISLSYLSAHSATQTSASGYITVGVSSTTTGTPPNTSGPPADGNLSGHSSNEAGESSRSGSGSSFIHVPHPHLRRSKSKQSFEATRGVTDASGQSAGGSTIRHSEKAAFLSTSDLDGDETEGDEYWAEGSGWWNGVGLDQVDEVRDGIRELQRGLEGGKLHADELETARLLLAYHHHAVGEHEQALTELRTVKWDEDPKLGVVRGEAAVLDRIRGRCIEGMSLELLEPATTAAIQAYLAIVALLSSISPHPIPAYLSTSAAAPASRLSFEPHRELHRWVSTSLCRAAILSSRQENSLVQTLRILRTYHAYAASWPSSFRPHQRHRMLLLYLTALASGYPGDHVQADSPYLLFGGETTLSARAIWRKEVDQAIRDGQRLLNQTTQFPRAGAVNRPVRAFTALCMALADRSAALTYNVIEVLWWSMTLTFQSQSVLRHLTRLPHRKDQDTDAKRTFQLYVQLVLKSRETAQPESTLKLEASPSDEPAKVSSTPVEEVTTSAEGEEAEGVSAEMEELESDDDEQFIEALLVGVRILAREQGELEEGWRYACLARDIVRKAKLGTIRKDLEAEVQAVLGVVRMAVANLTADHDSRPVFQAQAINHLLKARSITSNSATVLYHLAYAQAEARSIDDATQSIHSSLEADSENVQAWHLLALLLTAKKDWEGARKACEAGIAVWEADEATDAIAEDEEDVEDAESASVVEVRGVESRDFAVTERSASPAASASALLLPSGSLIDLPAPPSHKIARSRRLHNVIRLRMTYNVVIEKAEAAGIAMMCHQELFSFFSARSGEGRRQFGYGSGGMGTLPSMSTVGGLGGSYVSVLGDEVIADGTVSARPSTPSTTHGQNVTSPPRIITSTASSSPGYSTPEGTEPETNAAETLSRDFAEKGSIMEKSRDKDGRKSLTLGSRKGIAKHLHVPRVKSVGKGRPSSVRGVGDGKEVDNLATRNRTASNSSVALSVASTFYSHYHGTASPRQAPVPVSSAPPSNGLTPGESRMLSNLWLMSAATFRRWGKMEQCLVAINEAEILDPENGEVWVQLGLYHSASDPPNTPAAQSALTKAILLRPLHPDAVIHLSDLYLRTGQVDLAHSFLNQVTQDNGWDLPEAWVLLAQACKEQGRDTRERECLIYALELEDTRPTRNWREAVDRWL